MDHDQGIIINEMKTDRSKAEEEIGLGDFLLRRVERIVLFPILELCV